MKIKKTEEKKIICWGMPKNS